MIRVTVGDDITIQATLLLNSTPEDLTDYTSVKAAMVMLDKKTIATGTSVVDAVIVDAVAGLISVTWPRSETASIVPGLHFVEIQSEIFGKRVTYERVQILVESGVID